MKIIDLLNKIANGEQPNHIIFDTDDWYWGYDSYIPKNFLETSPDVQATVSLFKKYRIDYSLNDEIEIINEQEKLDSSKKIEKLPYYDYSDILGKVFDKDTYYDKKLDKVEIRLNDYHEKLNEIIDKLNKGE